MIASIIGYAALVINLYSMSLKGEHNLRIFSLLANTIYIVYGAFIRAYPIVVGSILAVLLHTNRIIKIKKSNATNKNC